MQTALRVVMAPAWFVVCWGIAPLTLISVGALLAFNPPLFVRVCRRICVGDYYMKSSEWEKRVVSLEGRIGGFLFLCFGLVALWIWLKWLEGILAR